MINENKNFLENLIYQKSKKDGFFEKIPAFETKLNECIQDIKKKMKVIHYRESYKNVINELESLLKKKSV
ncbi:MAG: hypothetical protein ACTSUT_19095 [Promethearchaeota archaeon]